MIETTTATGPSTWASYLVNADASGLGEVEREVCDDWVARLAEGDWSVVSVTEDEPHFAWRCDAFGSTRRGAEICTYVLLREVPR